MSAPTFLRGLFRDTGSAADFFPGGALLAELGNESRQVVVRSALRDFECGDAHGIGLTGVVSDAQFVVDVEVRPHASTIVDGMEGCQ